MKSMPLPELMQKDLDSCTDCYNNEGIHQSNTKKYSNFGLLLNPIHISPKP
jgi:hypothetical protein